jgi:uncharacterized damage-inducible protein DinB
MERLEIMEALKHLPDRIAAEVAGLSESVLRYRPAEGEWSIKEVVGHLRDSAEVWHKRLYTVTSLTDPLFVSFDGEQWVRDRNYQESNPAQVLAQMHDQRLQTVDLLAHSVDWTRVGQQPGVGRRSLKQFAEFLIEHDEDHLAQIRRLKEASAVGAGR